MPISLTSSSVKDNLVALINETNNQTITSNQVTFTDFENGASMITTVKAVNGRGYINGDYPNGFPLTYQRSAIDVATTTPNWIYEVSPSTTFGELQTAVANGLSVPYDDIIRLTHDYASTVDLVLAVANDRDCLVYATKGSTLSGHNLIPGDASLTILPGIVSVMIYTQ